MRAHDHDKDPQANPSGRPTHSRTPTDEAGVLARVSPLGLQRLAGNQSVSWLLAGDIDLAPSARVQLDLAKVHRFPIAAVQRQGDDVEAEAEKGAKETIEQQKQAPSLVLRVGNESDVQIAEAFLRVLEDSQPKLEKGAAMASPYQDSGNIPSEVVHGEEHKLKTQVPPEALTTNIPVMTDLRLYLAQARRLGFSTRTFQDQYRTLLTRYGRLESVAKNYAGMSLSEVHSDADAQSMVQMAVGAGGHGVTELSTAFHEMLERDPNVRAARDTLQTATSQLEEMPDRMTTDMHTFNLAVTTFDSATIGLDVSSAGVKSVELREAIEKAKTKLEQSRKFTEKVRDIALEGGQEGLKEGAKAAGMALAAEEGISSLGAAAVEGGPAAGIAIAEAGKQLVIDKIKEGVKSALENADAGVGEVDKVKQLALKQAAAQASQDGATIASHDAAERTYKDAKATMDTTTGTYIKTAFEFDQKRIAAHNAFKALGTAIAKAAKARGKAGQGKALAEMVSFLEEAEAFVVEANAVTDIAKKEMASGPPSSADDQSSLSAAAETMAKWNGKVVWIAYEYPFKKADGSWVTYYGANESHLRVNSFFARTPEEGQGLGTAEGGEMSTSTVISQAVSNVDLLKAKVLAVRAQISSAVFGAGG